jgi:putative acetyltransferase
MHIETDDLSRPAVAGLLREHLRHMQSLSPPESVHALDLDALNTHSLSLWTAWGNGLLLGCGALKELSPTHGEIKSMRTSDQWRRRGTAQAILGHIITVARQRNYELLSLETGSHPDFAAARRLYKKNHFKDSEPFAGYTNDPHSVFMSLRLANSSIRGLQ